MLYADKIKSLLNFNLLSILFIYVSFARRMEKNLTPNFVHVVFRKSCGIAKSS